MFVSLALEQILDFVQHAKADERIKPLHISLYLAIYQYWVLGDCKNPVHVSRRKLMMTAKISSIVIYHKGMNDLCSFKYISYVPSYDPRTRSEVYLLTLTNAAVPAGTTL